MKTKIQRIAFISSVFLFLSVISCKKEKKSVEIQPVNIKTAETGFTPYELVQVPLPEMNDDNSETTAELSGKNIRIQILQNIAYFFAPDLGPGDYVINFKLRERSFSVNLKLLQTTGVNGAAVYAAEMEKEIDSAATSLEQYAGNQDLDPEQKAAALADRQRYTGLLKNYKVQYEELTATEKQVFAKVIAANEGWIKELRSLLASPGIKKLNLRVQASAITVDDLELAQKNALTEWLVSSRTLLRNITKLAGLIFVMPVTGSIPLIGTIGTGIALGYMVTEVTASLSQNLAMLSVVLNTAFLPYQELSSGDFTTDIYNDSQEKTYNATAAFRRLVLGDESNIELADILRSFTDTYGNFKKSLNELTQKIPASFKPNLSIANFKSDIQSLKRNINSKYISVSNITNNKVQLFFSRMADGAIKLSATTSADTEQEFSYDINYSNPGFSSKVLKKTIKAKVKPEIDSTAIYTRAAVGRWTVKGYDPNNPSTTYTLDLSADGSGIYHVPENSTPYRVSWHIERSGKEYRLYEYGFWHPAYDRLTREKLAYPLKPFKVYGNFDPNFVVQIFSKN